MKITQDPRLGATLEVNILSETIKICSFDCPYCDLGPTTIRLAQVKADMIFPSLQTVTDAVRKRFQDIHENGPIIDTVLISGFGEPTLHPDFLEVVKVVRDSRNEWLPGKRIVVHTNGALLEQRKIVDALSLVDEAVVKIDAGNEAMFKQMNAPLSRTTLAKVISGAERLKNLTVQTMFHTGVIDNTTRTDVDDWIEVIALLTPKIVHIQGLSRSTTHNGLIRCEQDVLYAIASLLERRLQIRAVVTA